MKRHTVGRIHIDLKKALLREGSACPAQYGHFLSQPTAQAIILDLQVVPGLKIQPKPGRRAEVAREPESRIGRDTSVSVHDLVDPARRNAQVPRHPVLRELERLQELLEQDLSRVNRGQLLARHHTSLPLTRDLRLWRTGSRLAQRGSTASLVPRALSLPRRAPPPLWETSRAAPKPFKKIMRDRTYRRGLTGGKSWCPSVAGLSKPIGSMAHVLPPSELRKIVPDPAA